MKKFINTPKYILNRFIVLSIFTLIIGSLFDLQISKILYFRTSLIPQIIRLTGEMPMIIFSSALSFNLLYRYIKSLIDKDYKNINYPLLILSLVGFILPAIISANGIPDYFDNPFKYMWLVILFFYLLISILLSPIYKDINLKNLEKFFRFIFSIIILTMIIMNLLKNIWTRARFYSLYEKNDYKEFSFWLIPQFRKHIIDAYKSFPSGHTTSACVMLSWLFMPKELEEKPYSKLIRKFAIIWPITVAIERILDGAHYMTDVSFAILFSSLIIKLSHYMIYERKSFIKLF